MNQYFVYNQFGTLIAACESEAELHAITDPYTIDRIGTPRLFTTPVYIKGSYPITEDQAFRVLKKYSFQRVTADLDEKIFSGEPFDDVYELVSPERVEELELMYAADDTITVSLEDVADGRIYRVTFNAKR